MRVVFYIALFFLASCPKDDPAGPEIKKPIEIEKGYNDLKLLIDNAKSSDTISGNFKVKLITGNHILLRSNLNFKNLKVKVENEGNEIVTLFYRDKDVDNLYFEDCKFVVDAKHETTKIHKVYSDSSATSFSNAYFFSGGYSITNTTFKNVHTKGFDVAYKFGSHTRESKNINFVDCFNEDALFGVQANNLTTVNFENHRSTRPRSMHRIFHEIYLIKREHNFPINLSVNYATLTHQGGTAIKVIDVSKYKSYKDTIRLNNITLRSTRNMWKQWKGSNSNGIITANYVGHVELKNSKSDSYSVINNASKKVKVINTTGKRLDLSIKSIREFNSIDDWANWLDLNDTNIGLIDTIYNMNFKQLEFKNDLRLIGSGKLINAAPIKFNKSVHVDGISIDTVINYGSNRHRYGVAFYYVGGPGRIAVNLQNVNNSYSSSLIRVEDEQLKDSLFVDLEIKNINIKNNSNGGIHVRAICNNGTIDNVKISEPLGYRNALLKITDPNYKNSGNSYIDERESSNYNSGLVIGSRFHYSENIKINNVRIENLVIGHDATLFNNGGNKSRHTTGIMFAGNNSKLSNYTAINVERPFYLRGNNFSVNNIKTNNEQYPASYIFIHKGKRSRGLTKITNSEFKGKTDAALLLSSTDSTVLENVKFDIQPTNITYKLNDSLVHRKATRGVVNEGIFREDGGSVHFKNVDINIRNIDWTYYFIAMNGSRLNSLYFNDVNFSSHELDYFISARKFNNVIINNLRIHGKLFNVSNTNSLRVNGVRKLERQNKTHIFPIVYLTNVKEFLLNGVEIKTKDSILNRVKIKL